MQSFLQSSNRVIHTAVKTSAGTALTASGMVMKTAFLPVTVPLNVAASTTDLMINVGCGILHNIIKDNEAKDEDNEEQQQDQVVRVYHTPTQDILHNVLNFIPFVVQNTVRMVSSSALASGDKRRQHNNNNNNNPRLNEQRTSSTQPQSTTPTRRTVSSLSSTSSPS